MQYNYGLDLKELEKRTHKDYLLTKKMLDTNAPEFLALAEGDKIVVAISAAAASSVEHGAVYKLSDTEEAVAGVAYVEGITALTSANIPNK